MFDLRDLIGVLLVVCYFVVWLLLGWVSGVGALVLVLLLE